MTNIAMENPLFKWGFIAGKIIYFYGPSIPWYVITYGKSLINGGFNGKIIYKWTIYTMANC
jgi:hypothetical protein